MNPGVVIQFAAPRAGVPSAPRLRLWAERALAGAPRAGEVTIRVVDAEEGAALNRTYRGKAGPTNVLSFPYGPEPSQGPLGDLAICAPVVAREAREQGKDSAAHWAHMVVHGILHLLGHDHQTPAEALVMERAEAAILADLGFPDPYGDTEPP